MSNTTKVFGNSAEVRLDGSTDWLWNSDLPGELKSHPNGIFLKAIRFHPGAANDEMIVREEDAYGPALFQVKCANAYDDRIQYFEGVRLHKPVVIASQCTLGASASSKLFFEIG